MCYDISFTTGFEELKTYMPDLQVDKEVELNFEPTDHIQAQSFSQYPVILREEGQLKCRLMEWGIVPDNWHKKEQVEEGRSFMCNARSEKVIDDHKSYWHRMRHQRCIIPVTGIYEHRKIKGWKKNVPYFIQLKHRRIFGLPGLYHYSHIPGRGEEKTGTFTILTRASVDNIIMKQIHNSKPEDSRMVLFQKNKLHEEYWLVPDLSDTETQDYFSYELPDNLMDYHAVYTIRGGSDRPDGKDKTEPYKWDNLPPLGEDVQQKLF